MSVKAMAWVWDQPINRDEKFVLLAYADHADHNGYNIFPAVASVAKKTGYSERSIQRITHKLIESGWLIEDGTSNYQTNKYHIPIYGGDKLSPPTDGGIKQGENEGDKLSGGDTHVTGGVTKSTGGGDIAMSPEPSLTVIKPSVVVENIYTIYSQEVGSLTPFIKELLEDIEKDYPETWFKKAVKEAKRSATRGVSINYIESILKRWKAEGLPIEYQEEKKKSKKLQKVILSDGQIVEATA